jgi:hypothetical protein
MVFVITYLPFGVGRALAGYRRPPPTNRSTRRQSYPVYQANELICFCDGKIKKADSAIKEIVSELQTDGEAVSAVATESHKFPDGDETDIPF